MCSIGLCLVTLGALVLTGDGCIFDPASTHKPPPTPGGTQFTDQSTPALALEQLEAVYQNRDSVAVKGLYDSTYVGTSTDLTQPPQSQLSTFHYVDEIEHVASLARSHEIRTVVLQMGLKTRLPSDDISHPEWALIQISGSNVDLEIQKQDPDSIGLTLNSSGESFKFRFRPYTPAKTPTDTLWKLVSWEELYVGTTQP